MSGLSLKGKALLVEALENELKRHDAILKDKNSTEEQLAEIDYGNDAVYLDRIVIPWARQLTIEH